MSKYSEALELSEEEYMVWKEAFYGLLSRLALEFTMYEEGEPWLSKRAILAMNNSDLDEIDHVSSLLISQLQMREGVERYRALSTKWGELSREYHANWCKDCKRYEGKK